jgi:hypothetical protein
VWGTCRVFGWSDSDAKTTEHLVRFDLEAGVAEMRWPLPERSTAKIEALARHPSGRLAAVLSGGDVIVAKPGGGVTVVGGIAMSGPIAGLAWRGDDLELVPGGSGGDDSILVLSGGRWTSRAAPVLASPPGMHARLELAEHRAQGLVLTYVRTFLIPGQRAELITRREDGSETTTVLPLPHQSFFWIDRSAANGVNSRPGEGVPTIERVGDKWQFIAAPAGGSIRSDYVLRDGRLEWIPHDYYGRARIAGRWFDARDRHLLPIAGTTDLWAIDDSGAFVRLDRSLNPVETTGASAPERWLAFAALLVFPLALIATRGRWRRDDIARSSADRWWRWLWAVPQRLLARVRRMNQRSRALLLVLLGAMPSVAGAFGLYAGRERPADHRSVVFRAAGGEAPDRPPICKGPAVAEGGTVWRTCRTQESPPSWHLVRFDLERGVAEMQWPLPHERGAFVGMARHPSGRFAAIMSKGDVLVVDPRGGASMIGSVPVFGDIAGLAWLGDDIEVVTGGSISNGIHRFSGGRWTSRPAPDIEPAPDQTIALEMAERGPAGIIFTFVRTTMGQESILHLITRSEAGAESVQKLQLDTRLASATHVLDRAPANIISAGWYRDVQVERTDGKWQQVRPPSGSGVTFDYFFDDNTLVSIPREQDGPARLAGRWLDATAHVLPIAGTTDVWAFDDAAKYTRLDRNMQPVETMQATTFERTLAIAGLLVFPLALVAAWRARSRSRAG